MPSRHLCRSSLASAGIITTEIVVGHTSRGILPTVFVPVALATESQDRRRMSNQTSEELSVKAAEEARCRAISEGDYETLADLISEDVVYTHSRGYRETKAEFLANTRMRGKCTQTRNATEVRVFGDIGLVSGSYTVLFPKIASSPVEITGSPVEIATFQAWRNESGTWRLIGQLGSVISGD